MNYLAHIILSGKNKELMYGNFIGDAIKGSAFLDYHKDVRKGIILHRHIDNFTDNHPLYLKSKRRFYGKIDKLSGVVTDILYDYLLWENWSYHYSFSLPDSINQAYCFLDQKKTMMPNKIGLMYFYMRKNDWLNSYRKFSGIKKAIEALSHRVGLPLDIQTFHSIYVENKAEYNHEFNEFYEAVLKSVQEFHNQY